MKKRDTFRATPVVWISIEGEMIDDPRDPRLDASLATRFMQWCLKNRIYTAVHAGMVGQGRLAEALHPEDAKKAIAWLKAQGAEESKEIPQ